MSTPLVPLPLYPVLTAAEVAAALGIASDTVMSRHLRNGRFPGAYQTPGLGKGPGHWRIPHDSAVQIGRELGVFE